MLKALSGCTAPLKSIAFCSILVIICIRGARADAYKDRVGFEAPAELISFGPNIQALIFDTTICDTCLESVPSWRRLGALAVDSIYVPEEVEAVEQATQLEGLQINSAELVNVLTKSRTWKLKKTFPDSQPEDTIRWSGILKKWVKVPDLSTFYEAHFDTSVTLDSVIRWLEDVPGLLSYNSLPIPIMDSQYCPHGANSGDIVTDAGLDGR